MVCVLSLYCYQTLVLERNACVHATIGMIVISSITHQIHTYQNRTIKTYLSNHLLRYTLTSSPKPNSVPITTTSQLQHYNQAERLNCHHSSTPTQHANLISPSLLIPFHQYNPTPTHNRVCTNCFLPKSMSCANTSSFNSSANGNEGG